tara:strand:+ start:190 stop:597 length:408 start_codon:yes stop_codon:yes gene_type:complete
MMMTLFKPRTAPVLSENELGAMVEIRPRGDSYVRIGRSDYPVNCWSPTGFTLAPYTGSLIRRQKARVSMLVRDIHDPDGPLTVDGEVIVDVAEDGILSARWIGLPKYKLAAMTDYYAGKRSLQSNSRLKTCAARR